MIINVSVTSGNSKTNDTIFLINATLPRQDSIIRSQLYILLNQQYPAKPGRQHIPTRVYRSNYV